MPFFITYVTIATVLVGIGFKETGMLGGSILATFASLLGVFLWFVMIGPWSH